MYEELVKRLRILSGTDNISEFDEAADAIEELAKDLERSKDFEAFWQHEAEETLRRFQVAVANKPRWIPVTERLPKDLELVLINDEDGVTIGTMDVFVGNEETYYEWHDTHCYRVFPTHWMPLPEPPKEET